MEYGELISLAGHTFGVSGDRLMGTSREFPLPIYRDMVWRYMHENGTSLSSIGRISGRNHSTIIAGIRRLSWLMEVDRDIRNDYERFASIAPMS